MKIILLLLLIMSCNTKKKEFKYYILIETSTKSVLTGKDEIDSHLDSIFTINDISAFDSAALEVYGLMIADSILHEALIKSNNITNYPYYTRKIRTVKILNSFGEDISNNILDSVKDSILNEYGIRPF